MGDENRHRARAPILPPPPDPPATRKRTCSSCENQQVVVQPNGVKSGECRAHPPLFMQIAGPMGVPTAASIWPPVHPNFWCGEWKVMDPANAVDSPPTDSVLKQ